MFSTIATTLGAFARIIFTWVPMRTTSVIVYVVGAGLLAVIAPRPN